MPWQAYHTVWAFLVFGSICNYVLRMAFSPMLAPVMAEFGLSHAEGFLFSVFFYGYVAMQVPAGYLGDRFGRKRVLVFGIVLVTGAALVTGLSRTVGLLALARLLTGLAQGMYFTNDRSIIAAATPPDRLALGQGASFSGLGLGTALGVLVGGRSESSCPGGTPSPAGAIWRRLWGSPPCRSRSPWARPDPSERR